MSNLAELYKKEMIREAMGYGKGNEKESMRRDAVQAQYKTPNVLGPMVSFMGGLQGGGQQQNRFGNLEQLYQAETQKKQQETEQEDHLLAMSVNEISELVMSHPEMPQDQLNAAIWGIGVKHHGSKAKDYYGKFRTMSGPAKETSKSKKKDVEDLFPGQDSSRGGAGAAAAAGKKEDTYEIGAQYKNAQGQIAEYMGGGKWRML